MLLLDSSLRIRILIINDLVDLNHNLFDMCLLIFLFLLGDTIGQRFTNSDTAHVGIFILIKLATKLKHEQEFHRLDAGRNAHHYRQHHNHADVELSVRTMLVDDALCQRLSAVGLLAAGRCAVHASFKAETLWELLDTGGDPSCLILLLQARS